MPGRPLLLALLTLFAARSAIASTAADVPCAPSSPPPGPCVVTTTVNLVADPVTHSSLLDFGTRGLVITGNGTLDGQGAGISIKAASLVLQPKGIIQSLGGDIDATTTGVIQLQANADGSGRSRIDVSAGVAGTVTLVAGGDLTIAGQILAVPNADLEYGGTIDVTGANCTVVKNAKLSVLGGNSGGGGDMYLTASTGFVSVAGTLEASSGADGGSIEIDSIGNVTATADAIMDVHAGAGADAGTICIFVDVGGVSLAGKVDLSAGGDLINGDGYGGDFEIDGADGAITIDTTIDTSGGGTGGTAGDVAIDTYGGITLRGPINAGATGSSGFGGFVDISTTTGMIDVQDDIDAVGPGSAGEISLFSYDDIRVAAHLTADGSFPSVDLQGCAVNVTAAGRLSSIGNGGRNTIEASGQATVAGTLQATDANQIQYLDPAKLPIVTGVATPAVTTMQNPALIACGGPPPTTTTTSSSTTSTTSTSTATTSSTTTTTVGGPVSTTTTAATTSSTTATVPTTTTSTVGTTSSTTTTVPTTTTTTSSTTSSATTSSSTTSTVTTTSTTSTSTPSTTTTIATTSTTTPPSTTTTTAPSATCDPADCNDDDLCTEDTCDPVVGCTHQPRVGFESVTCRLDTLSNVLAATPSSDVGGPVLQRRYQAKIRKARHLIDVAEKLSARKQAGKLKRVSTMLDAFVSSVQRAEQRGKIPPAVADHLVAVASAAEAQLLPLRP